MDLNKFDWGWMMQNNIKNAVENEIFINKVYESFFTVDEGDIVLDIGASTGPFTYSIIPNKPKHVYCLEPSSIEFPTLNKNLRGFPVTTIKKGIGPSDSGFLTSKIYGESGEFTFIESISFQSLIRDYSLDKVDFIKTDCEGGEFHIFTEENLDFLLGVSKIVGEWHFQAIEEKDLFRNFRDTILIKFKRYEIFSVDGVDIKWDLWNEHFIEYYENIIIYIDNR